MASDSEVPTASDEDTHSHASTELYHDHEPFATFEQKVDKLCSELWPGNDKTCSIVRMKGGSDNRIVGIQISSTGDQDVLPAEQTTSDHGPTKIPTGDYVLRVSRDKQDTFEHDRSILELAGMYLGPSGISVPLVVHFDKGEANALGRPYCIQRRFRGSRLDLIWDGLNSFQREQIAFEMGRVFRSLESATNTSGGIPDLSSDRRQDGGIQTYSFPFPMEMAGTKQYLDAKPSKALMLEMLERWHQLEVPVESPWLGISEMVEAGWPDFNTANSKYYFCHGDLFPRNIMVEVLSDRVATVTAILDWDSAHFAPAIIAFAPPAWLWVKGYWQGGEDEIDEEELCDIAGKDVSDSESRIIKYIFDNWFPVEVREGAYGKHARFARKLWTSVNDSRAKSWVYKEFADTYQQWSADW